MPLSIIGENSANITKPRARASERHLQVPSDATSGRLRGSILVAGRTSPLIESSLVRSTKRASRKHSTMQKIDVEKVKVTTAEMQQVFFIFRNKAPSERNAEELYLIGKATQLCPLFFYLDPKHRSRMMRVIEYEAFYDGETVVAAGAPMETVYMVLRGQINGPTEIHPGDTVGSFDIFSEEGKISDYTYTARGVVECAKLTKKHYEAILEAESNQKEKREWAFRDLKSAGDKVQLQLYLESVGFTGIKWTQKLLSLMTYESYEAGDYIYREDEKKTKQSMYVVLRGIVSLFSDKRPQIVQAREVCEDETFGEWSMVAQDVARTENAQVASSRAVVIAIPAEAYEMFNGARTTQVLFDAASTILLRDKDLKAPAARTTSELNLLQANFEGRKLGFLEAIGPRLLQHLCAHVTMVHVQQGEILVREGDKGHCLYLVLSGIMGIFKAKREDEETCTASCKESVPDAAPAAPSSCTRSDRADAASFLSHAPPGSAELPGDGNKHVEKLAARSCVSNPALQALVSNTLARVFVQRSMVAALYAASSHTSHKVHSIGFEQRSNTIQPPRPASSPILSEIIEDVAPVRRSFICLPPHVCADVNPELRLNEAKILQTLQKPVLTKYGPGERRSQTSASRCSTSVAPKPAEVSGHDDVGFQDDQYVSIAELGACLAQLGEGAVLGEWALLRNDTRAASCVALTNLYLLCVSKETYNAVLVSSRATLVNKELATNILTLRTEPDERTADDLKVLDSLIANNDFFKKLHFDTRTQLCKHMAYVTYRAEDIMCTQGDVVDAFWLILRGDVGVYVLKAETKKDDRAGRKDDTDAAHPEGRKNSVVEVAHTEGGSNREKAIAKYGTFVCLFGAGQTFGEGGLDKDAKQSATVRAETNVELIHLSKHAYEMIMCSERMESDVRHRAIEALKVAPEKRNPKELSDLQEFLGTVAFFRRYPERIVAEICKHVIYWECWTNRILLQQGETAEHFFLILSGTVGVYTTGKSHGVTPSHYSDTNAALRDAKRATVAEFHAQPETDRMSEGNDVQFPQARSGRRLTLAKKNPNVEDDRRALEKQAIVSPLSLPLKERVRLLHLHKARKSLPPREREERHVGFGEEKPDDTEEDDDESDAEWAGVLDNEAKHETKTKEDPGMKLNTQGCKAELHAGRCFGETGLLEKEKRNATIRTHTPCELLVLTRNAFEHLISVDFQRQQQDKVNFLSDVVVRYIARAMRVFKANKQQSVRSEEEGAAPTTASSKVFEKLTQHIVEDVRFKGNCLARENVEQDIVWLISKGHCEVVNSRSVKPLGTLGAGEFIGLTSVLSPGKRECNSVFVASVEAGVLGFTRAELFSRMPPEMVAALTKVADKFNAWHEQRLEKLLEVSNLVKKPIGNQIERIQEEITLEPFRLQQSAFLTRKPRDHNVTSILDHFSDYRSPEAKTVSFSRTAAFFQGVKFGQDRGVENPANVDFNTVRLDIMEQKKKWNGYLSGHFMSDSLEERVKKQQKLERERLSKLAADKDVPLRYHSKAMRSHKTPPDFTTPVDVKTQQVVVGGARTFARDRLAETRQQMLESQQRDQQQQLLTARRQYSSAEERLNHLAHGASKNGDASSLWSVSNGTHKRFA